MMSKEDLARFISTDLALQCTKARLIMAVELDADQAVQPAGILERAEDFFRLCLGARSGQLAPLAAHHVHSERYDVVSLALNQNSRHNGVCQCKLCLTLLTNCMCPSLTAVLCYLCGSSKDCSGSPGRLHRNEKSYRCNELCAFTAQFIIGYANQQRT